MSVTVHLPALLRELAGGATAVQVDGTTVRDVLVALDRRCPGAGARLLDGGGRLFGHVLVFVDGEDVRRGEAGLEAAVPDGAEVTIQQAMSGG